MSQTALLLFSVVAFIAIVTPGPTVLLALSNGTRFGLRRSCLGMAGAVVSDLVLMAAAALGLGALLKGYLFVSAFLPQFIAPAQPQLMQYLILAVTFAAIDFVVMFLYALAGARAVRLLRSAGARWLDRFCGAFMIFAAGSLALLYRRGN